MCAPATDDCVFQDCSKYPEADAITLQSLCISNETPAEEITSAISNNAELEKRTTTVSVFLSELSTWTVEPNSDIRIKDIQRIEIKRKEEGAKCNIKKGADQSLIFTGVCYRGKEVRSFVVVCNYMKHDSAHALLATNWSRQRCL